MSARRRARRSRAVCAPAASTICRTRSWARRRWRGASPDSGCRAELMAVYQPDGGFVLPERSIVTHTAAARALGAEIHEGERALEWRQKAPGCGCGLTPASIARTGWSLRRVRGRHSSCRFSSGWRSPERQVLIWTEPLRPEYFAIGAFPIFNMEAEEGRFYGFPVYGVPGFKLGKYHHRREQADPDRVDREIPSRGRGGAARGHPALFPGCGRRDAGDEDLHVHQLAGRALSCWTFTRSGRRSRSPRDSPATASSSRR